MFISTMRADWELVDRREHVMRPLLRSINPYNPFLNGPQIGPSASDRCASLWVENDQVMAWWLHACSPDLPQVGCMGQRINNAEGQWAASASNGGWR